MRKIVLAVLTLAVAGPALAIHPIPGSITYGGHNPRLQKSPPGSVVNHAFSSGGFDYNKRYLVQPDRSLKLVSRSRASGR